MDTRDTLRRELKDLARLAATMPKDGAAAQPAPVHRPTLQRPPTPSSISKLTVPPAVASVPPPAPAAAERVSNKRRGTLGVALVMGLAVAIGGGAALGRTLARRASPPAAAAGIKVVTFGTPAAVNTSPSTNASSTSATPGAAAAPPTASPEGTTVSAAALPAAAPAPAAAKPWAAPRRTWRPAPRTAPVAKTASTIAAATSAAESPAPTVPASPAATAPAAPPAPKPAATTDSLDEAIRKAIAP